MNRVVGVSCTTASTHSLFQVNLPPRSLKTCPHAGMFVKDLSTTETIYNPCRQAGNREEQPLQSEEVFHAESNYNPKKMILHATMTFIVM